MKTYREMDDAELFAAFNEAMDTEKTLKAVTISRIIDARRWARLAAAKANAK